MFMAEIGRKKRQSIPRWAEGAANDAHTFLNRQNMKPTSSVSSLTPE